MPQQFVILAGLPGSGKSTHARRLKADGFFVVSNDGLRLALNAGVYPREGGANDYAALEPVVRELADRAVTLFLQAGHDVAVDGTNLSRDGRRRWADLARAAAPGVRVAVWWCTGRFDSAGRWAAERDYPPGEYAAVRAKLEAAAEEPAPDEADEVRFLPAAPGPITSP